MLEKLRAFLDNKITECYGFLGKQNFKSIEREAFGACNFALTLTEDDAVLQLWEEYKLKFDVIRSVYFDV